MAGRVIGGALLGGVAIFLVGFVWYGLPFGPGSKVMRGAPDEATFQTALRESLPESGVYFVPAHVGGDSEAALEAYQERHRQGPVAFIVFQREGEEAFSPMVMLLGFLHGVVSCLLAAGAVAAFAGSRAFGMRWALVAFFGLLMAVFVNVAGLIWWSMPPAWVAVEATYNLVGWSLAALPIAALVRRRVAV